MALRNLYSLVRLVSEWNGVVVRPFASNSRLFGLPHLRANENWSTNMTSHPLSLLLDCKHLDNLACQHGFKPFFDFTQFLNYASRELVILHFIFLKESREYHVSKGMDGSKLLLSLKRNFIIECSDNGNIKKLKNDILESVNQEATTYGVAKFKIANYYCINGIVETTADQVARQTGLLNRNISVIILNWRGVQSGGTIASSALGRHKVQRQFIKLTGNPISKTHIFYPSEHVLRNTTHFVHDLVKGNQFIGIHIRSEKLGQRALRIPQLIASCLKETFDLKDSMETDLPTVVITDYGPFGSDSCRNCRGARAVKNIFQQNGISPSLFDPLFYGAPSDTGFVSLVEMNTLLQSRYLILVGGGAYQKQMASRVADSTHSEHAVLVKEVYFVCWDDKLRVKKMSKTNKAMY